ncbi:MAG: NTPase [Thermodesulfobacteriota bacterium]
MKKIFLTGRPGVGKTTVIMKVIEGFRGRVGGFYTEEIRTRKIREGFRIKTLDGRDGILSHVNYSGPFRVGRYGVDVDAFDAIAIPSLERAFERGGLIIIDEIGKMELFSRRFRSLIRRVLASDKRILGVIHQMTDPFTQRIRQSPDVKIVAVTEINRKVLPSLILEKLGEGSPVGR